MKLRSVLFITFVTFFAPTSQIFLPHRIYSNFRNKVRSQNTVHDAKYKYEINTIDLPVDHFSFAVQDTFKLRYLVNSTWRNGDNAPIFFYTGNEGDIETFAQNTGFMWEIAPEFGALLVFAEHRYYGESMPFGNKSYADSQHLGYLTSQQALADFVDLIQYLRTLPEYKLSPVILFGGSYGGMLSAWMRMKYRHIVQGAIAASAPILQFEGNADCNSFARITTLDFKAAHPYCPKLIRLSWSVISNTTSDDNGRKWLSDNWKLCQPLANASDVKRLKSYLEDTFSNIAMVDYPYASNFIAPLPAYPVNAACKHLTDASLTGTQLLTAIHKAFSVFTNYTGETKCLDLNDSTPQLGATGWPYQSCTEMVMPMCSNGVTDMFEPNPWDFNEYAKECMKQYSVKPQPDLVCKQYGCKDLSAASNIIFSNGLLDPWTGGGVVRNLSSSALSLIIPEGAHHLDLRSSNPNDPPSVVLARNYHRFYIKQWIKEYRREYGIRM